jgi:hypothetical protein
VDTDTDDDDPAPHEDDRVASGVSANARFGAEFEDIEEEPAAADGVSVNAIATTPTPTPQQRLSAFDFVKHTARAEAVLPFVISGANGRHYRPRACPAGLRENTSERCAVRARGFGPPRRVHDPAGPFLISVRCFQCDAHSHVHRASGQRRGCRFTYLHARVQELIQADAPHAVASLPVIAVGTNETGGILITEAFQISLITSWRAHRGVGRIHDQLTDAYRASFLVSQRAAVRRRQSLTATLDGLRQQLQMTPVCSEWAGERKRLCESIVNVETALAALPVPEAGDPPRPPARSMLTLMVHHYFEEELRPRIEAHQRLILQQCGQRLSNDNTYKFTAPAGDFALPPPLALAVQPQQVLCGAPFEASIVVFDAHFHDDSSDALRVSIGATRASSAVVVGAPVASSRGLIARNRVVIRCSFPAIGVAGTYPVHVSRELEASIPARSTLIDEVLVAVLERGERSPLPLQHELRPPVATLIRPFVPIAAQISTFMDNRRVVVASDIVPDGSTSHHEHQLTAIITAAFARCTTTTEWARIGPIILFTDNPAAYANAMQQCHRRVVERLWRERPLRSISQVGMANAMDVAPLNPAAVRSEDVDPRFVWSASGFQSNARLEREHASAAMSTLMEGLNLPPQLPVMEAHPFEDWFNRPVDLRNMSAAALQDEEALTRIGCFAPDRALLIGADIWHVQDRVTRSMRRKHPDYYLSVAAFRAVISRAVYQTADSYKTPSEFSNAVDALLQRFKRQRPASRVNKDQLMLVAAARLEGGGLTASNVDLIRHRLREHHAAAAAAAASASASAAAPHSAPSLSSRPVLSSAPPLSIGDIMERRSANAAPSAPPPLSIEALMMHSLQPVARPSESALYRELMDKAVPYSVIKPEGITALRNIGQLEVLRTAIWRTRYFRRWTSGTSINESFHRHLRRIIRACGPVRKLSVVSMWHAIAVFEWNCRILQEVGEWPITAWTQTTSHFDAPSGAPVMAAAAVAAAASAVPSVVPMHTSGAAAASAAAPARLRVYVRLRPLQTRDTSAFNRRPARRAPMSEREIDELKKALAVVLRSERPIDDYRFVVNHLKDACGTVRTEGEVRRTIRRLLDDADADAVNVADADAERPNA